MALHIKNLEDLLQSNYLDLNFYPGEKLKLLTSYRIGGPAKYYVQVSDNKALEQVVSQCESQAMPWFVIGRGTNMLIADSGFPGCVINLGRDFRLMAFDEKNLEYKIGAGTDLAKLVQEAFRKKLSGMEFAVGVPGTIGGALCMNAGTRGCGISSVVKDLLIFRPNHGVRGRSHDHIQWDYRSSSIADDEIILSATIKLIVSDDIYIREKMDGSLARRKKTQPLEYPSCGSIFKNPPGQSAGKLIEEAGLKGYKIGGAQISEKHANFFVNIGGAKAIDVYHLINFSKKRVYENSGVKLETEVKLIGF
ncbi:MAG: UDP-N-acetylmuramate dehydrogenase [Eggerthellaceae bacterium]|nr:UDP-N-acetylmuramate dehydrogenase [Eggerthellaceae bacterium]